MGFMFNSSFDYEEKNLFICQSYTGLFRLMLPTGKFLGGRAKRLSHLNMPCNVWKKLFGKRGSVVSKFLKSWELR